MSRRPATDYEIEALTKGLQVLEALEGIGFEPVSLSTVVGRTGFTRDFCWRALKTLAMRGYATCEKNKWTVGKRVITLGIRLSRKGEI